MSALDLAYQAERVLDALDRQISECLSNEIDCSYLVVAKEAIANYLATLKGSIAYKMDLYTYYGEPPDVDELRDLIQEIGYDQARLLYGDELTEAFREAVGEF